jgi:glycosyltransferase involved in cell wall biosynthesis
MYKPLFVISAPVDTYSGYGARARDIVRAVIELDRYEVKILAQRWGATPLGFLEDHQEEWGHIRNYIHQDPQLPRQPDVWMQITIPNEFQPVGKFNIGVTAGIETTTCAPDWIDGLNRMDLNLVSSKHSKEVFESTRFEEVHKETKQVNRVIQLQKPVEVLFEGVNTNTYKPLTGPELDHYSFPELSKIPEDFCYLFVGHWLQGEVGEDRKNVGLLVKSFYETFKNKINAPALVLKTSVGGASYLDRDYILERIASIRDTVNAKRVPNVYLLHGDLSDTAINQLYNHKKIKAMVSLTKGEGFGRPLLEFSAVGKPIIATGWSGQMDFLDPVNSVLIGGELAPVDRSAVNQWILADSKWLKPDLGQIGTALIEVFDNYKSYVPKGKTLGESNRKKFSYTEMVKEIDNTLTTKLPQFDPPVQVKLPTLKKIELPKLQALS